MSVQSSFVIFPGLKLEKSSQREQDDGESSESGYAGNSSIKNKQLTN